MIAPQVSPRIARRWLAEGTGPGHRRIGGSLLFADISGYTRLSERLAGRGRAGAEEAVTLIGGVLKAVTEAVESRGGDVLTFAGDAVIALFEGPDAPDAAGRAVDSAAAIRRWFDERARDTTTVGRVTLRAAVSVATGAIDLVLVGEDEMGLFVTGPTTTELVMLERAAGGGEVVIGPRTARAIGGIRRPVARGEGTLLPRTHSLMADLAAHEPELRDVDPPVDPRLIPTPMRAALAAGGLALESDHRLATMAFVVAGGIDARIAAAPAAVAAELDVLHRLVSSTAARHRVTLLGTDVTADGVALFLAAGAPVATGNDEERMLRTLRAVMSDPIAERLQLRAGTNRGPVFAGIVGHRDRATYSAMGDTTNLAARLAFRAQPGELLTTSEVLSRSATEFDVEAAPEFRPKGKAHPVTPYRVGAEQGRRERVRDRLPLVGRESEVGLLQERLEKALLGEGSIVSVIGEAGVGKSRLAAEVLSDDRVRNRLVLRFTVGDEGAPYAGFQAALRDLAGVSSTGSMAEDDLRSALAQWVAAFLPRGEPWLPLLGPVFGVAYPETATTLGLIDRFRRERLHALVVELLSAVLGPGSVILAEDLHWSDEASQALLRHLAGQAGRLGWLVLALSREGEPTLGSDPASTITLHGLDPDAVAQLALAATSDTPLSDAELQSIIERGTGNPLHIRELAVATAGRGGASTQLPDSLEQLLASRLDRIPPADRGLLRRAAVLGRDVELSLLADVLPDHENLADVTRWAGLDEFVEWLGGGQVRYRHDLYVKAAYGGLSEQVRRDLHGRVADAIRARAGQDLDPVTPALADHYRRARAHDQAFVFGRAAGHRARVQVAHADAARHYRRALASGTEAGLPSGVLAEVAEALGDVADLAGRYDESMAAYAAARRLLRRAAAEARAPDDGPTAPSGGVSQDALAEVTRKSGLVCEKTGRYGQSLAWFARAERLLDQVSNRDALWIRLKLDRSAVRNRQGREADAVALARAAASAAEGLGDPALQARAYYLLHSALSELGSREALAYRDRLLPLFEEIGDLDGQAKVLNNLGVDAYYEGRWSEAIDLYRRSGQAHTRLGDVTNAAIEANNEAEILSDQGRLEEARTVFVKTLRVWRAAGYEIGIALVTSNLGRLAARTGRTEEGLDLLRQALARFEEMGARYFVHDTNTRIADCLLLAGESEAADDLAATVLASVGTTADDSQLVPPLERVRGWSALRRGDAGAADAHFRTSLAAARESDARFEIAQSLHAMLSLPPSALSAQDRMAVGQETQDLLSELDILSVFEPGLHQAAAIDD